MSLNHYHGRPNTGYLSIPGGVIGFIEVHDTENDTRDVYYEPTMDVVTEICERFGFDLVYTADLLGRRGRDVYAFVFVVDLYRKHLEEMNSGEALSHTKDH